MEEGVDGVAAGSGRIEDREFEVDFVVLFGMGVFGCLASNAGADQKTRSGGRLGLLLTRRWTIQACNWGAGPCLDVSRGITLEGLIDKNN